MSDQRSRNFLAPVLFLALLICVFTDAIASPATDWLESVHNSDGSYGVATDVSTLTQSTSEVLTTYNVLGETSQPGISSAIDYINSTAYLNTENLSRIIVVNSQYGNPVATYLTQLEAQQNADGGFGELPGYHSTSIDTAFALNAFAIVSQTPSTVIDSAVSYLLSQQNSDGSFSLSDHNESSVYITSMCITSLRQFLFQYQVSSQLNSALNYIIAAQAGTGGWENQWESALALNSIIPLVTDKTRYAASVEKLRSEQLSDGSWSDDAYITALAQRALYFADSIVDPIDPTNGFISGRVINQSTGEPIAGASITLAQAPSTTVQTDANGTFKLVNIPANNYTLQYTASGFTGASQTLSVQAGNVIDVGSIGLAPLGNAGIIKGTVTANTDGAAVAGAQVSITGAFTATVTTDSSGNYQIPGAAGFVVITVSAPNYDSAVASGQLSASSTLIFSPSLFAQGTTPTNSNVTLAGVVVDGDTGQPIQGASIAVTPSSGSAVSDAQGAFSIGGLQSGGMTVTISYGDYLQQQLNLVASDGAVINLGTVRMYKQAPTVSSISGVVTDSAAGTPISGAEVSLVGTNEVTITNQTGQYQFNNLSGTQFSVTVNATGYFTSTRGISVTQPTSIDLSFSLTRSSSSNFDITDMSTASGIYQYGAGASMDIDVGMQNTGTTDRSVRTYYKVVNTQGEIVEQGPTIKVPLNGDPSVAILIVTAGGTSNTSFKWNTGSYPPDDYQVIAQIYDAQTGQLLAERGIGVTVLATSRIGGSAKFDPPITQLAANKAVNISAEITNTGNQSIEPTTVTATLRLTKEGYKSRQDTVSLRDTLTDASFSQTQGMDFDSKGNLYVANKQSGTVSIISPTDSVSVFASNLISPVDVDVDTTGNVYILQQDSSFVVIKADGTRVEVTTGIAGQSGIEAQTNGDAYITSGNALYNVTLAGIVTKIVSGGIASPHDMVIATDGTIYIASSGDNSISQYKNGELSTFVNGINQPYGLAIDTNQDLIVTSYGDNTLLRVTPQRDISVITSGLSGPFDVILDSTGNYIVSNAMSNEIVQVDRAGNKTVIGDATTNEPYAAVYNANGDLFVANAGSSNIIKYDQAGKVTEFANGISNPRGLIIASDGGLDVLQSDGGIQHVSPDGSVSKIADGHSSSTDFVKAPDGNGYITVESTRNALARVDSSGQYNSYLEQAVDNPQSMVKSKSGNIYAFAKAGNVGNIYKISPDYSVKILASGFGNAVSISVDANENVYLADSSTRRIYKIDPTGNVNLLATATFSVGAITVTQQGKVLVAQWGSGLVYELGTDGQFSQRFQINDRVMYGLTEDSLGNIWTSNQNGGTVTRVSISGVIDTFSGIQSPGAMVSDGAGGMYVGSYQGIQHISGTGLVTNAISHPDLSSSFIQTFAIDANGNYLISGRYSILYLLDSSSNLIKRFTALRTPLQVMDDGTGVLYVTNSNGIVRVRGEGMMPELVVAGAFRSIARESTTTAIVSYGGAPQRLNLVTGHLTPSMQYTGTAYSFIQSIATNPAGGFTLVDYRQNRLVFYGANDNELDIQVGIVAPHGLLLDQSGKILVTTGSLGGILSLRGDHRASAYVLDVDGFDYLLQKDNGHIYAASRKNGVIYEYDPNVIARNNEPSKVSTITLPESEALAIAGDGSIYSSMLSQGTLISIAADGTNNYQRLATGLSDAVDAETSPDGRLYITDKSRNSVVVLNQDKTLSLDAADLQNVSHIAFTPNGDRVVTYAANHLAIIANDKAPINLLMSSLISRTTTFGGIAINDAGLIHLSTTIDNTILKIDSVGSAPKTAVGGIVFQASISLDKLAIEAHSPKIDFGSWTPEVSGEYQIEVTTDNGVTSGSLVNTIHVGAKADGLLTLDEVNLSTGNQVLGATLSLSGIDTTKFTKIDPTSVTLDAVTGVTAGRAVVADTNGNVYAAETGRIVKVTPDGIVSDFVTFGGSALRLGQVLAIDSTNTMYLADSYNKIDKITPDGVMSDLVSLSSYGGSGSLSAIAVSYDDTLYALVYPDILLKVNTATGEVVRLPVQGITRAGSITTDGIGNVYIYNYASLDGTLPDSLIRYSPDGSTTEVFDGAYFEHEGQSFTADCSNNILMAPVSLQINGHPSGFGEESSIYELVGQTGEFSQVFNGYSAPQNISDMDALYYDRFGHRLLIYTDRSGGKVYSIPLICGGVDVSAHLITRSDVDLSSSDPAPTSVIDNADGTREYVWALSDVDSQGQSIQLNLLFKNLIEGEQRTAFQNAFLEFTNSFDTSNPARVQIDIPAVLASSQMSITPTLDAPQYASNSSVNISTQIDNGSSILFSGTLELSVLDSNGSTVEQLPSIPISSIAGLSSDTVSSQWNTGSILAGTYTVYLRLVNSDGVEVKTDTTTFNITPASSTTATLDTSVSTDKQQYESWDVVNLSGRVRNTTSNVIQLPSNATVTVSEPDGTVLFSRVYPIRELYPNSHQDLGDIINLVEAGAGQYTITLQLTDAASAAVLASSTASFDVVATTAQALTGSVIAQPSSVNAGDPVTCTSKVTNKSTSTAITDLPLSEILADTATAQIISETDSTQTIAASDSLSLVSTVATKALTPGEYLCILSTGTGASAVQLAAGGFVVLKPSHPLPTANAGPDQVAMLDSIVTLDGSASSDPEGEDLTYQWSIVSEPTGTSAALSDTTISNPSIRVDKKGTYTIQLIINDGIIDSVPDTVAITVPNTKPVAHAGPDQPVSIGQTAVLDGTDSTDIDGDALTYNWIIVTKPTGSTSTLSGFNTARPQIHIDSSGQYVLQLVVFDGTDSSDPDTVTLNVGNVKPVAHAGPDRAVQVGESITLDASGSTDANGDILSYHWTVVSKPSGSNSTLSDSDSMMPSIDIDSHGSYELQLIVNDGIEDSDPDTIILSDQDMKPVANAGPDQAISINENVTLDGSASSDADQDPLMYEWSILSKPAGSTASLVNATAVKPNISIDKSGRYIIQLIVDDGIHDSEPDVVVLDTGNLSPIANAGTNQTVKRHVKIALDGSASHDPNGDTLLYHWSLVSRPQGSQSVIQDADTAKPYFVADLPGMYVPQLIVNDGTLDSAPDTIEVTAVNQPPVCSSAFALPSILWPPDHKYYAVSINGVTDPEDDPITLKINSITQDEPVNSAADGDTSPDAVIDGSSAQVRSERAGDGNGRVYQIDFSASDGYDTCKGNVNVSVPHDKNSTAIDDGQIFDSTIGQ